MSIDIFFDVTEQKKNLFVIYCVGTLRRPYALMGHTSHRPF
jgi:hypothetical protein